MCLDVESPTGPAWGRHRVDPNPEEETGVFGQNQGSPGQALKGGQVGAVGGAEEQDVTPPCFQMVEHAVQHGEGRVCPQGVRAVPGTGEGVQVTAPEEGKLGVPWRSKGVSQGERRSKAFGERGEEVGAKLVVFWLKGSNGRSEWNGAEQALRVREGARVSLDVPTAEEVSRASAPNGAEAGGKWSQGLWYTLETFACYEEGLPGGEEGMPSLGVRAEGFGGVGEGFP